MWCGRTYSQSLREKSTKGRGSEPTRGDKMGRAGTINNNNNQPIATTSSAVMKEAISELLVDMVVEETFFIGKEMGRLLRNGELEGLGMLEDVNPEQQVVDAPGVDIFGEPLSKKHNFECECPRCHRTLAAQRFAPHLEKCMGMGRNSSRIASRRLAQGASGQSSQNGNGSGGCSQGSAASSQGSTMSGASTSSGQGQNGELQSEEEHFEEDEDDEDWTMERKRKHPKRGNDKISPKSRKGPLHRVRNVESRGRRGVSPSLTDSPGSSIYDTSFHDESDFAAFAFNDRLH